jgi:polyisoprenoid-binding protein YceI
MRHPQPLFIIGFTFFLLLTACTDNPLESIPGADLSGGNDTLPAPAPGADTAPRRFVIQEGSAEAGYSVHEELFDQEITSRTTVGTTSQVQGEMVLQIDARNGGVAVGENQITVNLESLTSNEERRDNRIRREWLESTTYPLATFVAREIQGFPAGIQEGQEATFQLVGDLTIRTITQSTTFTTTAVLNGDTISGTATSLIYMRDFGFEPPSVMGILAVTDGVSVTLRFAMKEQ